MLVHDTFSQSQQNFAHVTTVTLSWRVQNFFVICTVLLYETTLDWLHLTIVRLSDHCHAGFCFFHRALQYLWKILFPYVCQSKFKFQNRNYWNKKASLIEPCCMCTLFAGNFGKIDVEILFWDSSGYVPAEIYSWDCGCWSHADGLVLQHQGISSNSADLHLITHPGISCEMGPRWVSQNLFMTSQHWFR